MADVSIGLEYYDLVRDRLMAESITPAERAAARSVLLEIIRWGGWSGEPCQKTAAGLCRLLKIDHGDMARTLGLLESVGGISRVRHGRIKIIHAPEELRHVETPTKAADRNLDLNNPADRDRARKQRWRERHKDKVNEARRLARAAGDTPSDPPAAPRALPTGRAAAA